MPWMPTLPVAKLSADVEQDPAMELQNKDQIHSTPRPMRQEIFGFGGVKVKLKTLGHAEF